MKLLVAAAAGGRDDFHDVSRMPQRCFGGCSSECPDPQCYYVGEYFNCSSLEVLLKDCPYMQAVEYQIMCTIALGQDMFSEIGLFLNKPLVPGSFAAWGRTFSQKSDLFFNKPLVLGNFAAWGRTFSQNMIFF